MRSSISLFSFPLSFRPVDSLCGNFVPDGVDRAIVSVTLIEMLTLREFSNLIVARADSIDESYHFYLHF